MKTLATIAATLILAGVVSASTPATANSPQIRYVGTIHILKGHRCGNVLI